MVRGEREAAEPPVANGLSGLPYDLDGGRITWGNATKRVALSDSDHGDRMHVGRPLGRDLLEASARVRPSCPPLRRPRSAPNALAWRPYGSVFLALRAQSSVGRRATRDKWRPAQVEHTLGSDMDRRYVATPAARNGRSTAVMHPTGNKAENFREPGGRSMLSPHLPRRQSAVSPGPQGHRRK